MISGDDGAHFVAGRMCAGSFFKAARRRDDKLIGRKNQLCRKILARFRDRIMEQTRAAFPFRGENILGLQDIDDVPWFG